MTTWIGKEVEVSAKVATVIGEETKRGKAILTVKFEDGTIRKTPAAMVSTVEFAPPASFAELAREHRADHRRLMARMRID